VSDVRDIAKYEFVHARRREVEDVPRLLGSGAAVRQKRDGGMPASQLTNEGRSGRTVFVAWAHNDHAKPFARECERVAQLRRRPTCAQDRRTGKSSLKPGVLDAVIYANNDLVVARRWFSYTE
jgi:hypothetical protein